VDDSFDALKAMLVKRPPYEWLAASANALERGGKVSDIGEEMGKVLDESQESQHLSV
jgi:hypothetical protein